MDDSRIDKLGEVMKWATRDLQHEWVTPETIDRFISVIKENAKHLTDRNSQDILNFDYYIKCKEDKYIFTKERVFHEIVVNRSNPSRRRAFKSVSLRRLFTLAWLLDDYGYDVVKMQDMLSYKNTTKLDRGRTLLSFDIRRYFDTLNDRGIPFKMHEIFGINPEATFKSGLDVIGKFEISNKLHMIIGTLIVKKVAEDMASMIEDEFLLNVEKVMWHGIDEFTLIVGNINQKTADKLVVEIETRVSENYDFDLDDSKTKTLVL